MPTAEITLICKEGHRWVAQWPFPNRVIQVPHDDCCPQCGQPGKLIKAQRGD
jgi:hypothetical protein